jgi:hypothetical protein
MNRVVRVDRALKSYCAAIMSDTVNQRPPQTTTRADGGSVSSTDAA